MTTTPVLGGRVGALIGGLLAWGALLAAASPAASAAVNVTVATNVTPVVSVGQIVPATLTITNANTAPDAAVADTVATITYVPSCGSVLEGSICVAPFLDPGVLVPSGTFTGAAGSACAGIQFTPSLIDAEQGKYALTPSSAVSIPGPGAPGSPSTSCVITMALDVMKLPSVDANGSDAGRITDQLAFADVVAAGAPSASDSSQTDVQQGVPIVTGQVAPQTLTLGATFTDTATLDVGPGGASPTGSVRFDVYGPDNATCAGSAAPTFTATVNEAGRNAVSTAFTPPSAGTYRVVSRYLGDANYQAAASACGAAGETVTVNPVTLPPPAPPPPPATPVIATRSSGAILLGGQISDNALVSLRVNPVAGATVQFRLYGPLDVACVGAPIFTSTIVLGEAGFAASAPFTPTEPGIYRWRAFYSGDANNVAVSTSCDDTAGRVAVLPRGGPEITAAAFATTPRVGRSAVLEVSATDAEEPISGLQVRFGEARGLEGVSACRVSSLALAQRPVRLRLPYVFRRSGSHKVTIEVLSGDCEGALRRTTTTIVVGVAPAAASRGAARATAARAAAVRAAAASSCRDRLLVPKSTPASRTRVAAAVLCLVNAERRKRGRLALRTSPRLQRAANAHSRDMFARKYFEHERVPGGPTLAARLRRTGYRGGTYAENIGYGSSYNATLMVAAWMNSAGHRANILHPRLRFVGVGLTPAIPVTPQRPGSTYTMDFGATIG